MARIKEIVVDAVHPAALARFWAEALDDYALRPYDAAEIARLERLGFTPETDPAVALDGAGPTLFFQKAAAAKTARNRIHLDLRCASRAAEVASRPTWRNGPRRARCAHGHARPGRQRVLRPRPVRKRPMLDPPQILNTDPQLIAVVHLTVPRAKIRDVMGPGRDELIATVTAQGVGPIGPWFTHHRRMDPKVFDFEICVPVSRRVKAIGRVRPAELRPATVARTIYRGDYEGLGEAWGEFKAWIARAGHRERRDLLERYLVGPESSDDPADWQTELSQPLLAAAKAPPTNAPTRKTPKTKARTQKTRRG